MQPSAEIEADVASLNNPPGGDNNAHTTGAVERQDAEKGWNSRNTLMALSWMRRSQRLVEALSKKLFLLKKRSIGLIVSYIVLSTVSGGIALSGNSNCGNNDIDVIEYARYRILGALGITAAILAGLKEYFDFDTKIEKYKYVIGKFSKLCRTIEATITCNIEDRPHAKEFTCEISEKYFKYQTSVGNSIGDVALDPWKDSIDTINIRNGSTTFTRANVNDDNISSRHTLVRIPDDL